MTTGVLWQMEEGNVVSVRQAHALFVVDAEQAPPRSRTRPSLGPETRARRDRKIAVDSVSVRRANPRKWEEPAPGPDRTDEARLAACHRSGLNPGGRA